MGKTVNLYNEIQELYISGVGPRMIARILNCNIGIVLEVLEKLDLEYVEEMVDN